MLPAEVPVNTSGINFTPLGFNPSVSASTITASWANRPPPPLFVSWNFRLSYSRDGKAYLGPSCYAQNEQGNDSNHCQDSHEKNEKETSYINPGSPPKCWNFLVPVPSAFLIFLMTLLITIQPHLLCLRPGFIRGFLSPWWPKAQTSELLWPLSSGPMKPC